MELDFVDFKKIMQKHVAEMLKDVSHLFVVGLDKDALWNVYLDSFPKGTNELYKEKREYDCSACRSFVKAFGNVVSIKDNKIVTIWDFQTGDTTFQPVMSALSAFVKSHKVEDVFVTAETSFGTDQNKEMKEDGTIVKWDHLYIKIPAALTVRSSDTIGTVMSQYRSTRDVFKRSLEELSNDSVLTVLELISQNSLYKGEEWKAMLTQFNQQQKVYAKLTEEEKDNYCWDTSVKIGAAASKIRNHAIGVLLSDISAGMDLDEAVRRYEKITAPDNYKRPQAIFTKKMLEDAQKKIEELGLMDSLSRRYAKLDDITVNNILFANKDAAKRISGSVFDDMAKEIAVNPKKFDKVEEISIDTFIKEVLPTAKSVEVLFENKHASNMVSLIAPQVKDSKTMFKWNNGFSWAYNGNITDSMKERVKAAGGKVDGDLRFSIQWNTEGDNQNDFDAHCIEPQDKYGKGLHIYFCCKGYRHSSSGMLDVDIVYPKTDQVAVENITYADRNKMPEGEYQFYVNNFTSRGGKSGFSAEIEFDGQIFSFDYNKVLRNGQNVEVARVRYSKKDGFSIVSSLPSSASSRKVWGIDTNQFHSVTVCMLSPNYWDLQESIGHKHYFFMLNKCVNDTSPNGFFNEFLKEELMPQKRVFEALGGKMRVADVEDQLSGIGFSSTQRNNIVCKVTGSVERVVKINF